ncbi:MAG: hypothetical protein ACRDIC_22660 [bacterium]
MAAKHANAWAARTLLGAILAASALAQDTKTDADTGLVIDEGFALVKGQCTGCHSAKLITQGGKTREGWIDSIRWMQRNQGLTDLGATEEPILSYLAKNYPVPKTAPWRRPPLRAHLMPK